MRSYNLLTFTVILLLSSALADKPTEEKSSSSNSKTSKTKKEISEILKEVSKTTIADKRIDTVQTADEKSDLVEASSSQNYEAGAPVSQGNLYYYYYPVAAYPVNADDKVSSSGSSSVLDSPLIYILVPLVLLLIAVPLVSILTSSSR